MLNLFSLIAVASFGILGELKKEENFRTFYEGHVKVACFKLLWFQVATRNSNI